MKVVVTAEIHFGVGNNQRIVKNLAKRIIKTKADVIILVGDTFHFQQQLLIDRLHLFGAFKVKESMEAYKRMRDEILWAQDINPDNKPINLMDYANYAFRNGTMQEKREITNVLNRQLYIHNETVTSLPLI